MVKVMCCSCRGPWFGFQRLRPMVHSNSSCRGSDTVFEPSGAPYLHAETHIQNTHIHTMKNLNLFLKNRYFKMLIVCQWLGSSDIEGWSAPPDISVPLVGCLLVISTERTNLNSRKISPHTLLILPHPPHPLMPFPSSHPCANIYRGWGGEGLFSHQLSLDMGWEGHRGRGEVKG